MPKEPKEPQSYGSGPDWVTGKTGQEVNDQDAPRPAAQREFYDDSRGEQTVPDQGGRTSDVQHADSAQPDAQRSTAAEPTTKITSTESGAKRDSFFKKRDYE
jgi:hypothetical protein